MPLRSFIRMKFVVSRRRVQQIVVIAFAIGTALGTYAASARHSNELRIDNGPYRHVSGSSITEISSIYENGGRAAAFGFSGESDNYRKRPLVFEDVTVLPMDADHVLAHTDVIVEDGMIRSIGPHQSRKHLPAGSLVVVGTGKYLLPGFSDMHIHIGFGDAQQLKLYVVNGVTTVLNLHGSPKTLSWRTKIAKGEILGPTLYTSGPILDGDPPTSPRHTVVRNRGEAEKEVDAEVRQGYDFVKPYSALSLDAFEGIVDAAKRDHIRLVGHVSWNVGVPRTIEAGQDAIAHLEELYKFFVDRHLKLPPDTQPDVRKISALAMDLKEHNTWVITTLSANVNILDQITKLNEMLQSPEARFIPKTFLEACRANPPYSNRGRDWVRENEIMVPFLFKLAGGLQAGGVHLMAGTDATNPMQIPGLSMHDELKVLVQAGLTPYEALVTATRNPAVFLRRDQEVGTVAPGKLADLVLLDGNPLENIENTRRIEGVVIRGRWLESRELNKIRQELVEHFAHE